MGTDYNAELPVIFLGAGRVYLRGRKRKSSEMDRVWRWRPGADHAEGFKAGIMG